MGGVRVCLYLGGGGGSWVQRHGKRGSSGAEEQTRGEKRVKDGA